MKTKEIKDYLPFYLGCEMKLFKREADRQTYTLDAESLIFAIEDKDKPILRKLSDMTRDEKAFCGFDARQNPKNYINEEVFSFEQVKYLLSKHFDLFSLIESGIAIDKTTFK